MTNDEYIDKQQALSQILDILNVIAAKKANGEKIRRQYKTEPDPQERSLGEQAGELTNKATKAFQEERYDDAKRYLYGVLEIIEKLPDNNDHREAKAYMLNMLAGAECRQGLFDESVKHLREAISICEKLPDTVKYQYAKETFEDNLEEVEHKMKQANEHKAEMDKESDESLLDALQNKSGGYKKQKYKSQKDIAANYHFTNEKPKSFDDVTMKLVLLVVMIVFIFVLLKFC